ncbi:MAG: YbaK/EbsC family protein [Anaerolineales bacterium]|nr:YbaK/EbsC family protein [Anaerolineales bacterium]
MKYAELKIQTQREAPNNAQTEGFAFLVRAGYLTRENEILPLGKQAISHIQNLSSDPSFLFHLTLPLLHNKTEIYFSLSTGSTEIVHCSSCNYTERLELAQFEKTPFSQEEQLPIEKVLTPDCNTIESLANFLNIPKEKTAKALMYTRTSDNQFIFVVVRGDMTLSEAKLKNIIGEVRMATAEEITNAGAAAGFASPVGLKNALIVMDDIIPQSPNLAAGANEDGYHLLNTNCGRDYSPEIAADLIQAKAGESCIHCASPLATLPTLNLAARSEFNFENILLALAETHHDEKGLTFPKSAAPFDVYLMHIPGKAVNTVEKAEGIYNALQSAGISVLFDDRDERAGVKFNDADLIGCPIRVTVGEKNLKDGNIEIKERTDKANQLVPIEDATSFIKASILAPNLGTM